jgi:F-type H+-transporting ATPase subunit epsilon
MSDAIQVDIVTPEKKIFSENNILSVTVPGIEGDMGILNNHIPIITFLRPGTIQIQAQNKDSSFFISDGVLEFSNNVLTILASEIYDLATIDSNTIDKLKAESKEKMQKENQSDNDIFLASKFEEEVNGLSSAK